MRGQHEAEARLKRLEEMQGLFVPLEGQTERFDKAVFLTHGIGIKGKNNVTERRVCLEGEKAGDEITDPAQMELSVLRPLRDESTDEPLANLMGMAIAHATMR